MPSEWKKLISLHIQLHFVANILHIVLYIYVEGAYSQEHSNNQKQQFGIL